MKPARLLLLLAWPAFCSAAFAACHGGVSRGSCPGDLSTADTALPPLSSDVLSGVDRTLTKEPTYRSSPRYCLLVFGPEAKTRVWLVQDGDILYVDRNGNGDLTDPAKKVLAEGRDGVDDGTYAFKIGAIQDGAHVHKELNLYIAKIGYLADSDDSVAAFLAKNPNGRGYRLDAEVEMAGWKGNKPGGRLRHDTFYADTNGVLQFAERPGDAPVIHFGGPWQIRLYGRHQLTIGRDTDVYLGVGTPGLGPGTMTYIEYDGVIPENVYPTLDITYASSGSNGPRRTARYELKGRC